MTISKSNYEAALKTIENYEKRQKELSKINSDLGSCLQQFTQFKFDIDKGNRKIVFAGVHKDGRCIMTNSVANSVDVWEESISILIAVKKALVEYIDYISKYIHHNYDHSKLYTYTTAPST